MSVKEASLTLLVHLLSGWVLVFTSGCQSGITDTGYERNTTDPTNKNASYVGSKACQACHSDIKALHSLHGHSQILKKLSGGPPSYPAQAARASVPNPPTGYAWTDLTYVIGGYMRKALFLNSQGYILTDGAAKTNTQWNLDFLANGTAAGWAPYASGQNTVQPYDYACFSCHTTGPSATGHQDSLAGIEGTFAEPGVQCEACHGPGSNHIPNPPLNIYINQEASACGTCHSRGTDKNVIPASDGFIQNNAQYQELLASPHANFRCATCHDPHTSTEYQATDAIINTCQSCHPDKSTPLHKGIIFVRGDYVEPVTCVSCHMTFATRSASSATAAVVAADGRQGDIKTHLWYINTDPVDYKAMFTADGGAVRKDAAGHGTVTLDFVCLRCHSDVGRAFKLSVKSAADIAVRMHDVDGL